MNTHLTSLTLQDGGGVDVPLMIAPYRGVSAVQGLAGLLARTVTVPATGMHGGRSRTRYRDARTVMVTGTIRGEGDAARLWAEYDAIARAAQAAVDTDRLLKWTAGGRALQAAVRLVSLDPPIEVGPELIRYQLALYAGDPRGYGQNEVSAILASSGGGGLIFPIIFPFTFEPSILFQAAVTNTGTVPSPPTIILSGELVDPTISLLDDPTAKIVLHGTIAAGEKLYIYTSPERRVLLNNEANRINFVDFAQTRWFEIPPGPHTLHLTAAEFDQAATIEVRFRSAYE